MVVGYWWLDMSQVMKMNGGDMSRLVGIHGELLVSLVNDGFMVG